MDYDYRPGGNAAPIWREKIAVEPWFDWRVVVALVCSTAIGGIIGACSMVLPQMSATTQVDEVPTVTAILDCEYKEDKPTGKRYEHGICK